MRRPAGAQGSPREVAWVLGILWVLGLLVMLFEAISSSGTMHHMTVRAFLMAGAGAAMSALIWRFLLQRDTPLGGRIALLCGGVALAIAVHVLLDLATKILLHQWFGTERMRINRVVIFENPARTFFIRLFVETNIALYAVLHGFFGIAATALRSSAETRERERLLTEARAATISAQLAMLRYQINPHFVFNTLNAIGSLVESGRNGQAGTMIEKLSEFLRSSLGSNGEAFSTLEEELGTVEAYLDIEAVRFGDRLRVQYDVARDLGQALVPSFLLQPLIENAIKHAVSPAMRTVTLRVLARADEEALIVTVEDDGSGRELEPALRPRGAGVGLVNVRERLSLLFGAQGLLDAAPNNCGYVATIRMPLQLDRRSAAA